MLIAELRGSDPSGSVLTSLHLPVVLTDSSAVSPACSFGLSLQCLPLREHCGLASPFPRSGFHSEASPSPTLCVTVSSFASSLEGLAHRKGSCGGNGTDMGCDLRALETPGLVV